MNIQATHLTAGYGHGLPPVLHDLSFSVPEGSRVSILGANGCGKTTLFRCMLGLLPCEGEIRFGDRSLKDMSRKEIASRAALMSQLSESYFSYTVRETVLQGRFLHMRGLFCIPSRTDYEVTDRVLAAVGLSGEADRPITELSGGQRQRVFLARTLAQETPVLFLDEPTNHLDLKYQAELTDYLLAWSNDSSGGPRTLISVFHDINLALRMSDYVIVLKKGRLLADGPVRTTLTEALLAEAFDFDVAAYMRSQLSRWTESGHDN